jgi:hypothetical protein
MPIKLFEVENSRIKPTEHCYTIAALKRIMDEYPEDYLSIYAYLFYMTCMNEDLNPFSNTPESEKEDLILEQVGGNFSSDEEAVDKALRLCHKLYETPTSNAYRAIKIALENVAYYMSTTPVTDGRDGNIKDIIKLSKEFNDIRRSYNETLRDFKEEQSTTSRGNQQIAYDQI